MFFRRKPSFPLEKLSVRILADVNDVDPVEEEGEVLRSTTAELPTIGLVANWFVPRITIQLCLEEGDGCLQWLTESDVARWGAPQSELFSSAIDNLNARVSNAKLRRLNSDDGGAVYTPVCEGVTLSSLIVADRLLSDFDFAKKNIAAVIPNRDTYYFCDKASPESIDLLKHIAGIAWDDEDCPKKYRITKNLLVADNQAAFGWAPQQQPH